MVDGIFREAVGDGVYFLVVVGTFCVMVGGGGYFLGGIGWWWVVARFIIARRISQDKISMS